MIQLENVSRDYGDGKVVHALNNVRLKIDRGERVAVMGPSGSGKSTLLNLICGLDEPTAGAVKIDGVNIASLDDDARTSLRREKIGMVFQTFNLLATLTALENVSLPLRLQGTSRREADRRAKTMLERVGLGGRVTHRPDELSGGERQRIAIARALIFHPPILLADEPTGNLDSKTGEEILGLLDDLHREFNATILMVTHNEEAAAHCDRILWLRDGRCATAAWFGEERAQAFAEHSSGGGAMISALANITWKQWRRHRLRTLLTLFGIALGVAVFFAVRTANVTLISSLTTTIEKVAGKATLQISGGESGFPESVWETVKDTPGVKIAEPAIEVVAHTAFEDEGALLIVGVDMLGDGELREYQFDEAEQRDRRSAGRACPA